METFEKSIIEIIMDGMDISLLAFNRENGKIQWSGANNPLWYTFGQESKGFKEIVADKQPVGKYDKRKPFLTHQIEHTKNTMFYLFTDGYPDQFGGSKGKKFKYKPFKELLLAISHKSTKEQLEILNITFDQWRGEIEPVDDVCIIGIRI